VHFWVVHQVALVQEDDDGLDSDLPAQQDVLSGLRHGSVSSRYHKHSSVKPRSSCDHIFDIIGVTWAIDMAVVPLLSLVFEGCSIDGDTSGLLLWGLVDVGVVSEGRLALLGEELGDGGSERGFSVINMA